MSRRHAAKKRETAPDIKYGSVQLGRFISKVMERGKRSLSEKIVYGAFQKVESKHRTDPFAIFNEAMSKVKPTLITTSVRVGGANYQVPTVVDEDRGFTLATCWLIAAAKARSEHTMIDRLAGEFMDAANDRGGAIRKRNDVARMAESNRAYAHLSPKKIKA